MKSKYLILILILLISIFTKAQGKQKRLFNLADCIEIATHKSLEFYKIQNVFLTDYWTYRNYRAVLFPSVYLNLTPIRYYSNFIKRYDYNENIDVYRKQQSIYSSGGLTVAQNFRPTGGTFTLETNLDYMKHYGNTPYSQFSSIPFRISYSQSLFGFNQLKWDKKIEPLKFRKAKKEYLYSREKIAEQATQYFFNLAMAQAEYHMAQENVTSTDSLYGAAVERGRISGIAQSDLLTLHLDFINAENSLATAAINLERAKYAFISFFNLDKRIEVDLELPVKTKTTLIPIEQALQLTEENSPDILSYQQHVLNAEMNLDEAKKNSSFDATLSASIGFNQAGENFAGAYQDPARQEIVNIGLTIPLLDWGIKKGKINIAQSNLDIARFTMEQNKEKLEQEIRMAVSEYNSQQELIKKAHQALNMAIEAYNITKQRYIIGKEDINSLTLSLNRRKEAQRNYITALANYWINYYRIRKLTLYDFERQAELSFQFDQIK